MPVKRMLKVFLCHASQDKDIVRELRERLSSEGWIDPWLDEKNILPGQDFRVSIEKAVESSDLVVICLSNNSVNKDGFVQKELRYAREVSLGKPDQSIFLIPLRLEKCDVPRGLQFFQWTDYYGDKKENEYRKLLETFSVKREEIMRKESLEKRKTLDEERRKKRAEEREKRKIEAAIRKEAEDKVLKIAEEQRKREFLEFEKKLAEEKALRELEEKKQEEKRKSEALEFEKKLAKEIALRESEEKSRREAENLATRLREEKQNYESNLLTNKVLVNDKKITPKKQDRKKTSSQEIIKKDEKYSIKQQPLTTLGAIGSGSLIGLGVAFFASPFLGILICPPIIAIVNGAYAASYAQSNVAIDIKSHARRTALAGFFSSVPTIFGSFLWAFTPFLNSIFRALLNTTNSLDALNITTLSDSLNLTIASNIIAIMFSTISGWVIGASKVRETKKTI